MKLNTPWKLVDTPDYVYLADSSGKLLTAPLMASDEIEEWLKRINGWDSLVERHGVNQRLEHVIAKQGEKLDLARELLNKMWRSGIDTITSVDDLRDQARYILELIREEV